MDSVITAAARALAAGDPLGAVNRVALRDDAPALALRGIAMAQLGDLGRARSRSSPATWAGLRRADAIRRFGIAVAPPFVSKTGQMTRRLSHGRRLAPGSG
jgi:hypothetical protein